jgi:hypothetical protein
MNTPALELHVERSWNPELGRDAATGFLRDAPGSQGRTICVIPIADISWAEVDAYVSRFALCWNVHDDLTKVLEEGAAALAHLLIYHDVPGPIDEPLKPLLSEGNAALTAMNTILAKAKAGAA